jgi:hypothetical protein
VNRDTTRLQERRVEELSGTYPAGVSCRRRPRSRALDVTCWAPSEPSPSGEHRGGLNPAALYVLEPSGRLVER